MKKALSMTGSMKKSLCTLAVALSAVMPASAQQYLIVNGTNSYLAEDVEKITYETDTQFDTHLMPGRLAADENTTLFSAALKLTGLADSLQAYWYPEYVCPAERKYYYKSHTWREVAWFNEYRYKQFTVFAETDAVFAAHGINSLDDLKAYAKRIYDEAFPEDAGVSDPTDRRHSLNRFMAYHVLCHAAGYWYLTYYDGQMTDRFVDTSLTDMNVWYRTLMPQGTLKCSYPRIPASRADEGVYLNRRGLRDGKDKYGYQIRGAKVVKDEATDDFEHSCFNGYYYYIDDVLAYDSETRNNVLGSDLWRMDFKTLSSDIMNNAEELRGNYLRDDDSVIPDDSDYPKNGRNFIYRWNAMKDITGNPEAQSAGLIHRRAHCNFWSWQGDEVNLFGDFDFTIKLPPLPAGEWEVRLGACALETRAPIKVYLNGKLTKDSIGMTRFYSFPDISFGSIQNWSEIIDYLFQHYLKPEAYETNKTLLTDLKTGEQIVVNTPMKNLRTYISQDRFTCKGYHPTTEEELNWQERFINYRQQSITEYMASLSMMRAPRECKHFNASGTQYDFHTNERLVRYVLGRLQTDGKSDNYLRIVSLIPQADGYNFETMLDYLELVPKAVYDNQEIPEE